ncbi:MAG: 50S ribosomal protein L32 [Ruminococcaceae bacterium]|nr:50S ribosomal protein L32 [Oscillospiraceae bacterium]
MAVPKGKISRQRRDKRRSSHWKLDLPNISKCPKCGEPVLSHRACKNCGTYRGLQVMAAADAE